MNILSFDTCLNKTYVTLYDGCEYINEVIQSTENNYHSAYLISTIVKILKSNGLTPNNLNYIATDIGPGSFTGIRACTTVARMLAQQLDIGLIGVSSLEILSRIDGGNDLVALDARKNKAYFYNKEIKGAIELEEVDKLISDKKVITEDSLYMKFKESTEKVISYQQGDYPLGEILTEIAIEKINANANSDWRKLKPLYIQPPPVFNK